MKHLKIAIIQFPRSKDKKENIKRMLEYLNSIDNADIVIAPEVWLGGYITNREYTTIVCKFLRIVRDKGFAFIDGGNYIKINGEMYSRCHVILPGHDKLIIYEKQFPSLAVGERGKVSFGERSSVFEYKNVKMGVVVCVDLMYPEIIRNLTLKGAVIIFNPSNIPVDRNDLWLSIGVARAAENTVYIVMANNTNTTYPDGRPVKGHSFVVSPDARTINDYGEKPGIYYKIIDVNKVYTTRLRWPYLLDIKRNIKKICEKYYNVS